MLAILGVILLAASPGLVLGGNRAWEAPLNHQVQLDRRRFDAIPIDEAGYAVRETASNTTAGQQHGKRWFGISPGQGPSPVNLWPDKTISYCYDTTGSRDKLKDYLENAMDMWAANFADGDPGLNRLVYHYKQVANPGADCTNNKQRDKILVISYNDEGRLATTVGRPPLDAKDPNDKGPTMELSPRDDVGQLNIVANFAHEIGHAWGLYHEHQNPKFWKYPFNGQTHDRMDGGVFGNHFDCTALKDYFIVRGKIDAKYAGDPAGAAEAKQLVCRQRSAASHWNFSAAEWLPIVSPWTRHTPGIPSGGADYTHVDWKSIMLYPSGAGGIGSAAPGPPDNPTRYDGRARVLKRNDNVDIHPNSIPSKLDVAGIRKLYESDADGNQAEPFVLPNDKKSNRFTDFIKDFTGKKNQHCERPAR